MKKLETLGMLFSLLCSFAPSAFANDYWGEGRIYNPHLLVVATPRYPNLLGTSVPGVEIWLKDQDPKSMSMKGVLKYAQNFPSLTSVETIRLDAEAQIRKAIRENKMVEVDAYGKITLTETPITTLKGLFGSVKPAVPAHPLDPYVGTWQFEKQPSVTITIKNKKFSVRDRSKKIEEVDMDLTAKERDMDGFLIIEGRVTSFKGEKIDKESSQREHFGLKITEQKLEVRNEAGELSTLVKTSR